MAAGQFVNKHKPLDYSLSTCITEEIVSSVVNQSMAFLIECCQVDLLSVLKYNSRILFPIDPLYTYSGILLKFIFKPSGEMKIALKNCR